MRRRLKVSSHDLRYVLTFAVIIMIVSSGVAYTTLFPAPREQFFATWILGSNGLAENYYPNNNSTLTEGELINWTLGVYNHMNRLEYVVLRVKLLNSSMTSPDELAGAPSPVQEIFEFAHILVDNETWSIPFAWRILNLTREGQTLLIGGLAINHTSFSGALGAATSGFNFRLVFELWYYNESTGDLSFAWSGGGGNHSIWTQIWFNATLNA